MPKSATVLLIRHAEKSGMANNALLTAAGRARAQAYVAYFRDLAFQSPTVPVPAWLIAAADSVQSMRSRLTLTPLSEALGLPIDATIHDHDFHRLADRLLGDALYDQCTTLVCWHHGQILALAHALGAPDASLPATWPEDVFGWILRLDYDPGGQIANVHAGNQRLMFGDIGASP